MLRTLLVALFIVTTPALIASPAAATHACVDDVPCYPHVAPAGPKELIVWIGDTVRCLVLAQPPTACV